MLKPNGSVDWQAICERLNPEAVGQYPPTVYDLLSECMQLDPARRISALDAYRHPFLRPDVV